MRITSILLIERSQPALSAFRKLNPKLTEVILIRCAETGLIRSSIRTTIIDGLELTEINVSLLMPRQ